ncbi:MAG: hypothetical protein ACLQT7_04285 [Candidatus Dormibacteria bacterium]
MSLQPNGGASSDDLVARAIRQLIDSVPGAEEAPPPDPETSTSQPWAETSSPSASNKRPLEALLAEYAARVEATPGATAHLPGEPHPSTAFYDRFARGSERAGGSRRRRRRVSGRKRRGGPGRSHQPR